MGSIKPLIIGSVIMVAIMLGSFNFLLGSINQYGLSGEDNVSSQYNTTLNRLNGTLSGYSDDYTSKLKDEVEKNPLAWIGFVFIGFADLVRSFFDIGLLVTGVVGDMSNSQALPIPSWAGTAIIAIVSFVIIFAIAALLMNRNQEDM